MARHPFGKSGDILFVLEIAGTLRLAELAKSEIMHSAFFKIQGRFIAPTGSGGQMTIVTICCFGGMSNNRELRIRRTATQRLSLRCAPKKRREPKLPPFFSP
jgi:hypothetical protein